MQRNGITICSSVLVISAFSGFVRWVQNQSAFELDTGLMIPGKFWSKAAMLVCVACIAAICMMVRRLWYQGYYPAQDYSSLINGKPVWLRYITRGIGAVMVVGACIAFLVAGYELYSTMVRTLCVLAVAAAWSFVKLTEEAKSEKASPMKQMILCSLPVAMYVYWLIVSYRTHAAIPSVWSYAVEVFAICLSILGTFYFAGYGYEFPRPYAALAFLLSGCFLSLVTLLDDRNAGLALMMAAGAAMQMYYAWMIITSMSEEWPEEAEVEEVKEAEF